MIEELRNPKGAVNATHRMRTTPRLEGPNRMYCFQSSKAETVHRVWSHGGDIAIVGDTAESKEKEKKHKKTLPFLLPPE